MAKNIISNTTSLSLKQAATLIAMSGQHVSYNLKGEPGIGKSSVLKLLAEMLGDKYDYIYVDSPLIDLPDFAMPYVENRTTHYAPSAMWRFHSPKPKVIMLDEVSKAPAVVKPMFTRLTLEHTIGEFALPEGSIVFLTGNLASDGVGDTMQAHINNRITTVQIGKPTAEEWIEWAINHNVNENVLAAVHAMPECLASYVDEPVNIKADERNLYIFNPKTNSGAFVSPRSLFKAGFICDKLEQFGRDLTLEALKGTVGAPFAEQMMAYLDVMQDLPTYDQIEKNPEKCPIPRGAGQLLLIFGSIGKVNKKNAEAYTRYFFRFDTDLRMLWARQFKTRLENVMGVKEFRETLVKDHWVFA